MSKSKPQGDVSIGKFDILATYVYARGLLDGLNDDEAKQAARTRARDALSKELVPLFHPRYDRWSDHFRWSGSKLTGRTATGRATIVALGMNRPAIVAIRRALIELGRSMQD